MAIKTFRLYAYQIINSKCNLITLFYDIIKVICTLHMFKYVHIEKEINKSNQINSMISQWKNEWAVTCLHNVCRLHLKADHCTR